MNEPYHFHSQLNILKIAIVAVCVVFLVVISVVLFIPKKEKTQNVITPPKVENEFIDFEDKNKDIILTFNKTYGLKQFDLNQRYILELRSDKNLNILVEKKDLISDKNLYDIAKKDKENYIKNFNNTVEISELKELHFNSAIGYTYSFEYTSTTYPSNLCMHVIWCQGQNSYYITNVIYPKEKQNENSNILTEIVNTFKYN